MFRHALQETNDRLSGLGFRSRRKEDEWGNLEFSEKPKGPKKREGGFKVIVTVVFIVV